MSLRLDDLVGKSNFGMSKEESEDGIGRSKEMKEDEDVKRGIEEEW
jgi:hypothetical protein